MKINQLAQVSKSLEDLEGKICGVAGFPNCSSLLQLLVESNLVSVHIRQQVFESLMGLKTASNIFFPFPISFLPTITLIGVRSLLREFPWPSRVSNLGLSDPSPTL